MTWTNALLIGDCTLAYKLNGSTMTLEQMNEAGISIDTTGGIVTATWDGVTGSPGTIEIDVFPAYSIVGVPARIADVTAGNPTAGAQPTADEGYETFSFEFNPLTDLPWDALTPYASQFIGCFAGSE
jgi:hypothetical protein